MRNNLTRLEIIHALVALDAECEKQGIAGEICAENLELLKQSEGSEP